MADDSSHEDKTRKKKRKRKHKSHAQKTEEDAGTATNDDTQVSAKEELPEQKEIVKETPKPSEPREEKMAAKTKIPNRKWTNEEEQRFLELLKEYASQEENEDAIYSRVEWTKIKMDGFSPDELHEAYKRMSKKIRKSRLLREVVEETIKRHKPCLVPPEKREKPPAKPCNAFMLFCKAKRPSLVSKHPELTFAGLHKKMCEKWRDMPLNKRGKYVKKYEKSKVQYAEELQKFEERQRAKIKKPLSAFELWKIERMEDGVEEDKSEEELKEEWENMASLMKKGWIQAASSEKDRYDSEINIICHNKVKTSKKKTTTKETSTSDEATSKHNKQKASEESNDGDETLSNNVSGHKRKLNDSTVPSGTPSKKISKGNESNSDSSSSDDE